MFNVYIQPYGYVWDAGLGGNVIGEYILFVDYLAKLKLQTKPASQSSGCIGVLEYIPVIYCAWRLIICWMVRS